MALLRCDFFSEALSLGTSMTVILPQRTTTQIGVGHDRRSSDDEAPPVLYLLHGLSDDDTMWVRRTSIERYVEELGIAVVMPQVQRSFYTDQVHGGAYWSFVSEELPHLVAQFFRVSQRREDTFVAGLSMGGYGAWKLALRQPHRFAAAASLSGALDVTGMRTSRQREEDPHLYDRVFGPDGPGPDDDLLRLIERADPAALPRLGLWCGEQDALVDDNIRVVEAVRSRGIAVDVEFGPGDHDWVYWDSTIRTVLDWIGPRGGC